MPTQEARQAERAVIVIDVFIWSGHGPNEVKPMPAACSLLEQKIEGIYSAALSRAARFPPGIEIKYEI